MPLKNRQMQIPNGLKFVQPELKWHARPGSFDSIVQQVYHLRHGNPGIAKQKGWATEVADIEEEVDAYNTRLCVGMGWTDYITGEGGSAAAARPFPAAPQRSALSSVRAVAAGAGVIINWLRSGAEAVPQELAEKRAAICAPCPLNYKGDWTSLFTVPVSAAIQREINKRRDWKLSTSRDAELGVCDGCLCPMKLKIHMPLERITTKLPAEVKAALVPNCWIKTEGQPPSA